MPNEKPEVRSRSRVHIRMREAGVTLSAWRVELQLSDGIAAIVLADLGGEKCWYRGEGALLGAPKERLEQLWKDTLPESEPSSDFPQYG